MCSLKEPYVAYLPISTIGDYTHFFSNSSCSPNRFPFEENLSPIVLMFARLLQQSLEIQVFEALLQLLCNLSVTLFIMQILSDPSSITLNKCCGA